MSSDDPRLREYPVHPSLAPFVKCIWSLESKDFINNAPRERILPDGCVELVFHFHQPFWSHSANGQASLQPRSFVVGQMKRFLEIEPAGRIGFIAVRFFARGAYLFFDRPMSEMVAGVIGLDLLWKERATEWSERVVLAAGMSNRIALIERFLLNLLQENGRRDSAVERSIQLIKVASGELNIAQLASQVGMSGRHLARRFHEVIGLSPKEFARLVRFLRAVRYLKQGRCRTLTETAVSCGYFDQAHFNHDFREFAGMAPGEFFTFPNLAC
jgi:AraC-like DNA-binding protein